MNFFEDPAPILTETGNCYLTPEEAADAHALGLIRWDEAGAWHSELAAIELFNAVANL